MRVQSVALAMLALMVACTGEPVSKRVGPGSTVTVSLPQVLPDRTVGYGSALAGADPQRGSVTFVLCDPAFPQCDPSPAQSPRQGYRLETTYVARAQVERSALQAGARLSGAVIEVPAAGDHVPPPGTYRLEPRLVAPGQPEVALTPESAIRTLEITSEVSPPSPLAEIPEELTVLVGSVPRPVLSIRQQVPEGAAPVASAELEIQIPSDKVTVLGVSPGIGAVLSDLAPLDADTVRVLWIARSGAAAPEAASLELFFELAEGAEPAAPSEFAIVAERAYDSSGQLLSEPRFAVDRIF